MEQRHSEYEKNLHFIIRALVLNQVEFPGSGFVYQLPDVSRTLACSGLRSSPSRGVIQHFWKMSLCKAQGVLFVPDLSGSSVSSSRSREVIQHLLQISLLLRPNRTPCEDRMD